MILYPFTGGEPSGGLNYVQQYKYLSVIAITTPAKKLLSDPVVGQRGTIVQLHNEDLAAKLLAIGVVPGSRVEVVRKAPFGGGYYIKVDQQYIALRKQEMACIVMK